MFNIRPATEHDAKQIITFVQALAAEPDNNILHEPGTFNPTVEWERDFLRGMAASDNSVFLVAVEDGKIIGNVNASGGKRPAVRHVASIGIAVAQTHRGKGVGTALMQTVIDWAAGTGMIKRLELEVFACNMGAIRLYERFGFVVEGRKRGAIFKSGEYLDDLVMGKLLS